ncbi:MAG: hypothetical protein JKY61_05020 [Planctomycetes bacterium]|nr:hypothetical protein [Planctomycetota bacterium]
MRLSLCFLLTVFVANTGFAQSYTNETVHINSLQPRIASAFGNSVALDGDWLAIGDAGGARDNTPDILEGSVDLYRRTESGWIHHQEIFGTTPVNGDGFGRRVALDAENGRLLVGVPKWSSFPDNPSSPYFLSGRAYLFELVGGQWTHSLTLRPLIPQEPANLGPDAGTFRRQSFGYSVDIEGDRMAIGAPFARTIPLSTAPVVMSGLTYTYKRIAGNWTVDQIIEPPQIDWGYVWDSFGTRLDLDGDRLAVSGYLGTQGKAFLFENTVNAWQLIADFDSPLPGAGFVNREFGYSVSLDGDRLAVGAPSWHCSNSVCPSVVAIFEKQGADWVRTQVLDEINFEPGNNRGVFGTDLKLQGDYLLASLPGTMENGVTRGQTRLYKHQAGQGFQLLRIYRHRDLPISINSLLGMEVDADFERGIMIAGDPNYHYSEPASPDGNGSARGAVLQFDLPLGQNLFCRGTPNTFGAAGNLSILGSLSVTDSQLTLHATQLPPGKLALFLYGQSGQPYNIQSGGELCIRGGIFRMLPAGLVGPLGERILDVNFSVPREAQNLMPGTTWAFQVWHRDQFPGSPSTTGTTNAVEVLMQ